MHSRAHHDGGEERAITVSTPRRLETAGPGGNGHAGHLRGHAHGRGRGSAGREFTLADAGPALQHLGRIVGRYWWIGFLLAAAELALVFAYVSNRQEMVTAETTVVAESSFDRVMREDAVVEDRELRENLMRNHLAVMTSRRFRTEMADSLTPEEAEAVQAPLLEPGEEPSPMRLRSIIGQSIAIERERGRDLFVITATHPEEDVALMLADRFVEIYLDQARSEVRGANTRAQAALQAEAEAMDRGVEELEKQRESFQVRFDEITGGGGREVIEDRIRSLNEALSVVRVERAQAEVEYRQAQEDLKASPTPFNNPTLAAYGNTPQLRAGIDEREAERAMLTAHYGPNHPKRLEADRAIETLRAALEKNFEVALRDLEARVALAASQENELTAELNVLLKQATDISRVSAELATLDQRIAARRNAYSDLLARIAQAGISAELPTDVMRVIDLADVRHPMLPPRVVLMGAGIVGAVVLFIGGPLLWHTSRRRVTSTMDLERILNTDLYGVVPRMPWMWASQRPHVVRRGKRLPLVESFLQTASQFELRSNGGCPRRIVITSTLPGEGKSVVASNLATAFTRMGYRSLLVDADFRRPSQQRFHRVPNHAGLLRWIAKGCPGGGEASLEDIGLHALPGGTWLLPTGGTDPEPARHFMRREVHALFERLAREFDVIIIDTSPAGLFPDAFFVTRFADATALVVREGLPSMDQVRKVVADFSRTATPINGIIFNAISGGVAHPSFGYRRAAARYARHYAPPPNQLPARVRTAVAAEPVSR